MKVSAFMGNVQIFIPSLDPDDKLGFVVEEILLQTEYDIVLLDDGSVSGKEIFDKISSKERCTVLRHAINLGKGRALKDGFNHILNVYPDTQGVVTVDGDGQHLTKDIIACADAIIAKPQSLVLGSRDFNAKDVPFKNGMGNKVTSKVMKLLCGINIPDTQTGLRGISKEFMEVLLSVPGERFEYETNMLICAKENDVPFEIVPIETVYLDNNATTHFNPLRDSIKIYSIFMKFLFASSSSFLIDIAIFSFLVSILRDVAPLYYIFVATAVARVISAVYNFNINKKTVFKNFEKSPWIAVKYVILCAVQLFISAFLVKNLFALLFINESIIKIVVDMILFFASFTVQREWVFKTTKSKNL